MPSHLSRRDFHKLTSAALGGMAAGTWIGCHSESNTAKAATPELHTCRGLNACKGQGADGKNACAGQGTCAAVHHGCAQQNDCKHQGGCGETPGMNDCKTKGGCEVPLQSTMWQKARTQFEERMKQAGKEVGAAPPAM
ncbi:MAG TPA: twin-arginine translocation signal domain-containing protein [Pirellulales bacterium]|nr:twin-arginine translocation signal domain-containing protein [Pirellulales bacterium]